MVTMLMQAKKVKETRTRTRIVEVKKEKEKVHEQMSKRRYQQECAALKTMGLIAPSRLQLQLQLLLPFYPLGPVIEDLPPHDPRALF